MPPTTNAPQQNFPPPLIRIFETPAALGRAAARDIIACAAAAITRRGKFTVAVSGGSLPTLVFPALVAAAPRRHWAAWRVFWADERMLPPTHPDSNFRLARETLLNRVPIPPEQIFAVDTTLPAAQTAAKYQTVVETEVGCPPRFDLILLGMGPDGHTASLFPGHPLLSETTRFVAPVFDSPKPPPERVTLTLPALNAARRVFFIVTGPAKAGALAAVFGAQPPPAGRVRPAGEQAAWFVDRAAAEKMSFAG